jgi:hypothetical protein
MNHLWSRRREIVKDHTQGIVNEHLIIERHQIRDAILDMLNQGGSAQIHVEISVFDSLSKRATNSHPGKDIQEGKVLHNLQKIWDPQHTAADDVSQQQ